MKKHNKKIYIFISGILFIAIASIFFTYANRKNIDNQENTEKSTESATLLIGDKTVHLTVAPNTLFYDALVQAKNQGKIEFQGKNHPGLGFFITDIGSLHAGNGKDLLYYVNGQGATVGVSSYTLKDGDIVEWKLE